MMSGVARGWRGRGAARGVDAGGRGSRGACGAGIFVLNTASGGHAVVGYHLSRQLALEGHAVTLMVPGNKGSEKMQKEPFCRWGELRDLGVATVWGEPADCAAVTGGEQFDVVVDNNGKDLETCQPVIDWAASQAGAGQYLYVSSAGIYLPSDTPPLVEGDPVDRNASHVAVEEYLAAAPLAESIFRPQYIIGPGNNKDCEEWFFDRIARGRPVPIPGDGLSTTNVAQAEDLAKMIALAVGNEAAKGELFNCVADRGITLDGMVRLCAEAAGRDPEDVRIVHYKPEAIGVNGKKAFPFRYTYHFFSEPRAAVAKLGMTYTRSLGDALKERWAAYIESGRAEQDLSATFVLDDEIFASLHN